MMDPLRLLTRATKLSKTAASRGPQAPTKTLPSSGANANPQLYGRNAVERKERIDLASIVSKKRKRGQEKEDLDNVVAPELDFFNEGAGSGTKSAKSARTPLIVTEDGDKTWSGGDVIAQENVEVLDEESCKRILREHKVKVTVLDDLSAQEVAAATNGEGSKKKKRKKQLASQVKKKNHKVQLFPQPLTSFTQLRSRFRIPNALIENIMAQGYKVPTEVQLASLPLLLVSTSDEKENASITSLTGIPNIDLLAVAPTGSGKTLAFLLPIITAINKERRAQHHEGRSRQRRSGPTAVVLAPTKELASQIVNEGRKLTQRTGVKMTLMKKGMSLVERAEVENHVKDEESDVSEAETGHTQSTTVKSDIIVSTPLTLLNSIRKGPDAIITPLADIQHLILDEADVLLDPLFREQTLSIWTACSSASLRTSFWSATMGSSIEDLVMTTLRTRRDHATSRPFIRLIIGLKDSALPTISHKLTYCATEQGKLLALRQLLNPSSTSAKDTAPALRPPFIIFTQTIPRAIALHSELRYDIPPEAGGSSRIAVLHSSLSDTAREDTMRRFRLGEVWVLITTDLLARGVDFRGVNGVVNYDCPSSAAGYVHRVGRTGRAGREGGVAVTLYAKEDIAYIKNIANVISASEKMKTSGAEGNAGQCAEAVPQWLLDALPTPTKRDKQRLKKRGVEERRVGLGAGGDGKEKKGRISTKSGYERKLENRKKGAMEASKKRKEAGEDEDEDAQSGENLSEGGFEGFDD